MTQVLLDLRPQQVLRRTDVQKSPNYKLFSLELMTNFLHTLSRLRFTYYTLLSMASQNNWLYHIAMLHYLKTVLRKSVTLYQRISRKIIWTLAQKFIHLKSMKLHINVGQNHAENKSEFFLPFFRFLFCKWSKIIQIC